MDIEKLRKEYTVHIDYRMERDDTVTMVIHNKSRKRYIFPHIIGHVDDKIKENAFDFLILQAASSHIRDNAKL